MDKHTLRMGIGLAFCLLLQIAQASTTESTFKLTETTIASVHHAMQTHQLSCVELLNDYLTRIKQYDLDLSRGAPINAFVALNPSVMDEAKALDDYYAQTGQFKGPLHCIPIIIKDNIDSIEMPSTSGSLALLGSQPVTNAFLVQQLQNAGAIIIGKGAMDEFASGMMGISSKSGRIGNAYDPTQNPGGSSGGPAAAVSANFAMVGIGTDNSGSVRIPAAYNGLYGLRPSTGLISQSGIFPRGNLDGVAGIMARTVSDLAITLSVIAKSADVHDAKTQHVPRVSNYASALNSQALKGKRIGVIRSVSGKQTFAINNKTVMAVYNKTLANLHKFGAVLVDIKLENFNSDRKNNMAGEIEDVNDYLATFPSTRENYRDICTSNRTRTFGSINDCLKHLKNTDKRDGKKYQQVLAMFKKNRDYVEKIMDTQHLDALLMPLNAEGGPSYDSSRVNTWRAPVSSNAGLPAITIIGGYTMTKPALPIGLELIGKMYGESGLISLAYSYECQMPHRQVPLLTPSTQVSLLTNMSIAQINNLFTLIGNQTYQKYLKHAKTQMVTAGDFTKLVEQYHLKK